MASGDCERCGTHRRWLHRHHTKPRAEGGTDEDGIELICANCHEDEHGSPFGQTYRAKARRKAREELIPPEELRRLYHDEGMSVRQIAARLKTAPSNVQFWLDDYEIERRSVGRYERKRPPEAELVDVLSRMTQAQAARHYGVTPAAVLRWRKYYGIERSVNYKRTKD